MNVRMFVAQAQQADQQDVFCVWWRFGFIPYHLYEDDARHFHQVCHDALAPHGADYYPRYKRWCDEYFYLRYCNETRGIGGIFYDDLNEPGFEASFALTRSVGNSLYRCVRADRARPQGSTIPQAHPDFQAIRRGRYVEFNLVFDRGTLFGRQSGGRTESILLSMATPGELAL